MGLKNKNLIYTYSGFPGGSDSKKSAFSAGDTGEVNGYPLQYSCLENSMDRGTWWATVHGAAKSQTRLSDQHTAAVDLLTFTGVATFYL